MSEQNQHLPIRVIGKCWFCVYLTTTKNRKGDIMVLMKYFNAKVGRNTDENEDGEMLVDLYLQKSLIIRQTLFVNIDKGCDNFLPIAEIRLKMKEKGREKAKQN